MNEAFIRSLKKTDIREILLPFVVVLIATVLVAYSKLSGGEWVTAASIATGLKSAAEAWSHRGYAKAVASHERLPERIVEEMDDAGH